MLMIRADAGTSHVSERAEARLTLTRLYLLRACYLILAIGLGVVIWSSVISHTSEFAIRVGAQMSLLAGFGVLTVLGLRYPVQMLPLLLFEILWKAIYLTAFALPLWAAHEINAKAAGDIQACLVVVILLPLISWRYVIRHYLAKPGERWR